MPNYRVTVGGKEYQVEIPNIYERPLKAIVDGEVIEVQVETAPPVSTDLAATSSAAPGLYDIPAKHTVSTAASSKTVRAPLPGTILRLTVKVGDSVQFGQELCVLEAMKMNNPIRATRAGKIAEIFVAQGQQVLHNEPLLAYED
jgi:biotin carboxyl carrier protein